MAANGLSANPTKTTFIIINDKEEGAGNREVLVGNVMVKQEKSAKLLGVTMDDNLKWNTQIYGKNGTISSLNSRMFIVKRIANQVGKESIKKNSGQPIYIKAEVWSSSIRKNKMERN